MTTISPYDLSSLFTRIASDDHAAFTELFHYYNARLFRFLVKMTKSEMAAEEIVQEVFMRLWVNREKLSAYEDPGGWLFLVAANLSLNYQRDTARLALKHQVAYWNQREALPDTIVDELDYKVLLGKVEEAVQQLPPKRQQVFRMSRQEGKSYQEIASELSISINTVKDHLLFAMRFIREQVQKEVGMSISVLLLTKFLSG